MLACFSFFYVDKNSKVLNRKVGLFMRLTYYNHRYLSKKGDIKIKPTDRYAATGPVITRYMSVGKIVKRGRRLKEAPGMLF